MNGFLLVYINSNQLGFAESMLYLELMVCIAFVYSAIVLLVQHAGSRRRRSSTPLIATFIVADVVFNGVTVAIITVLARTGLPTDCHGLTRTNCITPPSFNIDVAMLTLSKSSTVPILRTIRSRDSKRFTYMLTAALGLLRIFERHWMEKGRVDPLFASTDNVYQLNHMGSKIYSPDPSQSTANALASSEGIMTPTSRTAPTLQTQGVVSSGNLHRDRTFQERTRTHPAPVSPVSAASPISQVSPISPVIHHRGSLMASPGALDASVGGLMIMPSPDPAAEAAVTDGYRHQQHPGMLSLPPYSPGSSRGQFMEGHGNESNEMRLSEYVKGETRAQNMKDSGMGL
ncbi:hypothetical protein Hte_002022 [Hypoxylon texense]